MSSCMAIAELAFGLAAECQSKFDLLKKVFDYYYMSSYIHRNGIKLYSDTYSMNQNMIKFGLNISCNVQCFEFRYHAMTVLETPN